MKRLVLFSLILFASGSLFAGDIEKLKSVTELNFQELGTLQGPASELLEELQAHPETSHLKFDGGWSGGGGGGAICGTKVFTRDYLEYKASLHFFKPSEAYQATQEQLHKLFPDLFEKNGHDIQTQPDRTALQYLFSNVDSRLMLISPVLSQRLREAIEVVVSQPWQLVNHLPLVHDHGPMKGGIKGCQPVQLVVRFQKSQKGRYPETIFVADRENLLRMINDDDHDRAIVNFGMLILHEAVYLMGADSGHVDSSNSRALTAHLLSKDFYKTVGAQKMGYWFMSLYDQLMNFDFMSLITLYENDLKGGPIGPRNHARLLAFRKSMEQLRDIKSRYKGKKASRAFLEYLIREGSPEEVFLEVARQTQAEGLIDSSEYFIMPVPDQEMLTSWNEKIVCGYADVSLKGLESSSLPNLIPMMADEFGRGEIHSLFEAGLEYCHRHNLQIGIYGH
jgi:hypothetical protein